MSNSNMKELKQTSDDTFSKNDLQWFPNTAPGICSCLFLNPASMAVNINECVVAVRFYEVQSQVIRACCLCVYCLELNGVEFQHSFH